MITDLTPYRKHVDQFDLTEKEKLDLVNAVWMIVDSIYDQHLGLNQWPPKKPPKKLIKRLADSNCARTKRQRHSSRKRKSLRQRKRQLRKNNGKI